MDSKLHVSRQIAKIRRAMGQEWIDRNMALQYAVVRGDPAEEIARLRVLRDRADVSAPR